MQEVGKFGVKIIVVPNGLEKYMAFSININLFFVIQFMNYILNAMVKNSSDNDFKHYHKNLLVIC